MNVSKIKEVLKQNNDILQANNMLLQELIAGENKEAKYKEIKATENDLEEVIQDLEAYNLMSKEEAKKEDNVSFIRQLAKYKLLDKAVYLDVLERVKERNSKVKLQKVQGYIISSLKKEML